ncbi:hypothetical protein TEA_007799 [Camellia sinensis var. sinensis]|uniref:START domain-containing protein n=1 Tax=Camellia sinensis var. sinensis TaxID=542762 RepID=A0A4S4EFC4_CAMSN|nr:hypothetical protein TEA_007799 [Camellia sinensis var. sinensis]
MNSSWNNVNCSYNGNNSPKITSLNLLTVSLQFLGDSFKSYGEQSSDLPGPDSIGIVAISHGCTGVATRACGLVGLEPTRVAEILKDRPSWYRDCRAVDVLNVLPTANGGTIELLYMQLYAPTTLAAARDFCLLRYTSVMEDGSLVTPPLKKDEQPISHSSKPDSKNQSISPGHGLSICSSVSIGPSNFVTEPPDIAHGNESTTSPSGMDLTNLITN